MKKILLAVLIISLCSCSKSDNEIENLRSTEIPTGLLVTINGNLRTFNRVWVDQFVFNVGTPNEYTNLIIRGEIQANSIERVSIAFQRGRTGTQAIYQMYYSDSNSHDFYYDLNTNGGSFLTNVITNDNSNLLKGKFNGALQQNGGGIILNFTNGSFNITDQI